MRRVYVGAWYRKHVSWLKYTPPPTVGLASGRYGDTYGVAVINLRAPSVYQVHDCISINRFPRKSYLSQPLGENTMLLGFLVIKPFVLCHGICACISVNKQIRRVFVPDVNIDTSIGCWSSSSTTTDAPKEDTHKPTSQPKNLPTCFDTRYLARRGSIAPQHQHIINPLHTKYYSVPLPITLEQPRGPDTVVVCRQATQDKNKNLSNQPT